MGHPLSLGAREAGDAADDERVDDGDDGDRHEPEDAHLDHIQHVERRLVLAQDRALATSVLVLVVSISVLVLRNGLAYTPLTATTATTTRQLSAVSRGSRSRPVVYIVDDVTVRRPLSRGLVAVVVAQDGAVVVADQDADEHDVVGRNGGRDHGKDERTHDAGTRHRAQLLTYDTHIHA